MSVADPVTMPVLQVHGVDDTAVLLATVDGSEAYAAAGYTRVDLDGIGHFPHEEDPATFDKVLLPWLETLGQG